MEGDSQKNVHFKDIGLIPYQEAWDLQENIFQEVIQHKISNREIDIPLPNKHYLLFCEHNPVYTLGKSGDLNNLLLDQDTLQKQGIDYHKINRGGDITFHGPGQVVGYPILDLDEFFTDIHKYMRHLEEVIILTLKDYDLVGERLEGSTGVWLDIHQPSKVRKICAMGVRASRWVTMHGWAFNVNTDLNYFKNIIPCGIADKAVTSLSYELGNTIDINEVKTRLKVNFQEVFNVNLI